MLPYIIPSPMSRYVRKWKILILMWAGLTVHIFAQYESFLLLLLYHKRKVRVSSLFHFHLISCLVFNFVLPSKPLPFLEAGGLPCSLTFIIVCLSSGDVNLKNAFHYSSIKWKKQDSCKINEELNAVSRNFASSDSDLIVHMWLFVCRSPDMLCRCPTQWGGGGGSTWLDSQF